MVSQYWKPPFSTGISGSPDTWRLSSPWSNQIPKALGTAQPSRENLPWHDCYYSWLLIPTWPLDRWASQNSLRCPKGRMLCGVYMAVQHCPLTAETSPLPLPFSRPLLGFQIVRTFFKVYMKMFWRWKNLLSLNARGGIFSPPLPHTLLMSIAPCKGSWKVAC